MLIHLCDFSVGYRTYTSNGLCVIANTISISCLPWSTENPWSPPLHRKPDPPFSKWQQLLASCLKTLEATFTLTLSASYLDLDLKIMPKSRHLSCHRRRQQISLSNNCNNLLLYFLASTLTSFLFGFVPHTAYLQARGFWLCCFPCLDFSSSWIRISSFLLEIPNI